MRLHQAILALGMQHITRTHGYRATSVPVIVREEAMTGTGFFPGGREQTYHIDADSTPGPGQDLYLTGTGEVGLMGLHADEILDTDQLPLKYATVSTCFRARRAPRARTPPGCIASTSSTRSSRSWSAVATRRKAAPTTPR